MTDYTDLIARLRGARVRSPMQGHYTGLDGKTHDVAVMQLDPLSTEAAAAIEALQAEVARLQETPKPITALSTRPLYSHVTTPAVTHDDGSQTIFDQSGNGHHVYAPAKE